MKLCHVSYAAGTRRGIILVEIDGAVGRLSLKIWCGRTQPETVVFCQDADMLATTGPILTVQGEIHLMPCCEFD